MSNGSAGLDYKKLYGSVLAQLELLQKELEARRKEVMHLHKVREMQAKGLIAYGKQIIKLGGKPGKIKY